MPKFSVSPYWSANPTVPTSLDRDYERESPPPLQVIDEHICPTYCELSPFFQTFRSPSPEHTDAATLVETATSPPPAFQFDPEGRPQVRFRRNAFSPLSPQIKRGSDIDWNTKTSLGLGISNASFRPDRSPITPGTVEKANEDQSGALEVTSTLAQRIKQRLCKYSVVKRWLPEIVSWLLSAACMTGIVVMLFVYKNKRIPDWPLGLTLNAYISVLLKVASAALLLPVSEAIGQLKWSWFNNKKSKKMWDFEIFDNASRGAWGSFLLLVRTKGMTLAALGAAVTLFALAMDPFLQQVVEFPKHWRLQPETGTIPRATGYKPYGTGMTYRRDGGQMLGFDEDVQAVANRFFYDNGTTPMAFGKGIRAEVPLACPNSNCTWPQYQTLGTCSKCADVSDLLEFKCINKTLDWIQVPGVNPDTGDNTFPNGTACGWWLKADDPLLMTGYDVDRGTDHSGEVLLMRTQPLYDVNTRDPLPGYSAKLNHTRNPLAHAVIVSGQSLTLIHRNETPIAHECIISWCAKNMLSEYSEGGYTEIVNSTFFNHTMGSNPWTTFPVFGDDGLQLGIEYFYDENVTLISPEGITYEIDNFTQTMTLALFDDYFPSTYTLANSTDEADAMLRYKQYITINTWVRKLAYNPLMFANISTHMDHMTAALTNLMRTSMDYAEMITGPSYEKESIVDVRWVWMALPLGLLGLTFLFLVATIIRSFLEQEHIGVYKTSAMATLLYGLPDGMQNKIKLSNADRTPRTNAKETKIKWAPKEGWRFSGHTLSPSSLRSRSPSPTEWRK